MKKVTILMTAVFLAGLTYGQITNENIPVPRNNNVRDTIPPGWNGDTTLYKKWHDSLQRANGLDSLNQLDNTGRRNWERDSLESYKNNGTWQDSTMNTKSNPLNQADSNSRNKSQADSNFNKNEDHSKLNSNKDKTITADATKTTKDLSDRVMMKDGEMVLILNGNEEKMDKDYKFPNGTLASPDGTLKMSSGKTVKLKDGQYLEIKKTPTTKKKTKTTTKTSKQ